MSELGDADHWFLETSFTDKLKAEKRKPTLQLNFLDQEPDTRQRRTSSVGSGAPSVRSDRSGRTSVEKPPHLKWIDIEFANLEDRDHFLDIWQG